MAHSQTGHESRGYNVEEAGTAKADRDCFSLDQTRDLRLQVPEEVLLQEKGLEASTQNTEDDYSWLKEFCSEETNSADKSENSEENRKRKLTSEDETTNDPDAYKQSRPEACGISNQSISNFCDNGFINPDSLTNEKTTSDQMEFYSDILAFIYSEFPNFEESNLANQELKAVDYLDKETNSSTAQYTAYNKNIFQKEEVTCEIADTYISKVVNFPSVDNRLAVPGTLFCLENNSNSNLCAEMVRNRSPLKQQPPIKTDQKQSTCLSCKKTISGHLEIHDGKDMYRCCRCPFVQDNFNYLQMHVYNYHTKPYYCNICQVRHSISCSHVRGGTCDVCNQNFECKFQLEEHYISIHKDFLKANCRICKRKLDEHSTFSKGVKYHCCVSECKSRFNSSSSLNQHLCTHYPLKLSKCEVCGHHFKVLQDHLQNVHPLCKSCGKRFVNIYFLYEHLCEKRREK